MEGFEKPPLTNGSGTAQSSDPSVCVAVKVPAVLGGPGYLELAP